MLQNKQSLHLAKLQGKCEQSLLCMHLHQIFGVVRSPQVLSVALQREFQEHLSGELVEFEFFVLALFFSVGYFIVF
ncbi:MAG: hypothetical protein DCF25_08860 [Leptolyngbya foveolarum]|uniref:Uncharacterized protein n=1 Tax=Leptolyngbya foveolarum TaxID=47253 RepID=A0A2W4UFG3_9CYAN|nr:MAG: hypothetical protein DCF25_08860 [Leptolyngbya foveolarum]